MLGLSVNPKRKKKGALCCNMLVVVLVLYYKTYQKIIRKLLSRADARCLSKRGRCLHSKAFLFLQGRQENVQVQII